MSKQPTTLAELETKIAEHKALLVEFWDVLGKRFAAESKNPYMATMPRKLKMVDALVNTAKAELQERFTPQEFFRFLYTVYATVRDERATNNPRVLAVEEEYLRLGGDGLNDRHNVLLFTAGDFYEKVSGYRLPH